MTIYILIMADIDFIREHKDELCWACIPIEAHMTSEFLIEFQDYVDWEAISALPNLTTEFLVEFRQLLFFDIVYGGDRELDKDEIRAVLFDETGWNIPMAILERPVPEVLLWEFASGVGMYEWEQICKNSTLSDEFLRTNMIEMGFFDAICQYQMLSEEFMRDYPEIIDWSSLAKNESVRLSAEFVRDFRDRIKMSKNAAAALERGHALKTLELALPSEIARAIESYI